MISYEEVRKLVGRELPGGTFTIEPYKQWLTCDVVGSPELTEDVAHPIFAFIASVSAMGVTIDEFFTICHASASDGAVFGECANEYREELRVGSTYQVCGRITDVRRKEGQRAGVFDIVQVEFQMVDEHGAVAATAANSFVFKRVAA
jgi:hypothetical protein